MGRGFFIVLEGVDGTGKTTQASLLAEALEKRGLKVVLTREPSDGLSGKKLREYLRGPTRHLSAEQELALFMEDRREHVEAVIRPALEQGRIVISDRYYFSSAAYQGALGLDPEWILAEHEKFKAPRPDLAIFLKLPVAEALARGSGKVRQVIEAPAYLERVAAIYETFKGPQCHHLDAAGSVAETHARILAITLKALEEADGRV